MNMGALMAVAEQILHCSSEGCVSLGAYGICYRCFIDGLWCDWQEYPESDIGYEDSYLEAVCLLA